MGCCERGEGKLGCGGGGHAMQFDKKGKITDLNQQWKNKTKFQMDISVYQFFGLHMQIHMEYVCIPTVFEFKSQHGVKLFIGHKPVFF